uniref:Uncharacterized protein n=1 Tax=Oncorhynchus tshawytscha TaxID=74940 RepID=A0A8C8JB15_ONCTS
MSANVSGYRGFHRFLVFLSLTEPPFEENGKKYEKCVSCGLLLMFTTTGINPKCYIFQNSLNSKEGMGVASVSIAYSCIILSSRFLTPSLIRSLGCKWTIVASVIICLGGSPRWSAASTYLTTTVNHYFGIFFLLYQLSSVWGNLMSSLMFGIDIRYLNILTTCAVFINQKYLRYILLVLILWQLFWWLPSWININSKHKLDYKGNKAPLCTVFLDTFKQLRDKRQVLLLLLTSYIDLYATCALGIRFVGYVMICFGATASLFSLLFGKLSQYIGREALFHLVRGDNLPVLFVFPALWGNADAVWQTQIKAFYGVLFYDQKEVAFANYRLWESVGFVVLYALRNVISGNQALHPVWSSTCGSCTP